MSTIILRQQLHNYLEVAEDEKIKAIYTMMEAEIKEHKKDFSQGFKDELQKRYTDYKNGTAKMIGSTESKKRIQKILQIRNDKV